MDDDDYEIEMAYASDPVRTTNAVIAAAAAEAAAELAQQHEARREAELARVHMGQSESAALVAQDALRRKYGSEEYERLAPHIGAKLSQNPSLVPYEVLTSPSGLASALDDVAKIVKVEAAEEADANHWKTVMAANTNIFTTRWPLGPRGEQ
jgi:hypothetical protein